jgi:hypothetical protein
MAMFQLSEWAIGARNYVPTVGYVSAYQISEECLTPNASKVIIACQEQE